MKKGYSIAYIFTMSDLDTIFEKAFSFAKQEARQFYFQAWRQDQKPCPAFNGEVVRITRVGWDHFLTARHRTKLDLLGRFFVLERAKRLLETSPQFQEYEQRGSEEFWVIIGIVDRMRVKVVVRSIKQGPKHLYSVLGVG